MINLTLAWLMVVGLSLAAQADFAMPSDSEGHLDCINHFHDLPSMHSHAGPAQMTKQHGAASNCTEGGGRQDAHICWLYGL